MPFPEDEIKIGFIPKVIAIIIVISLVGYFLLQMQKIQKATIVLEKDAVCQNSVFVEDIIKVKQNVTTVRLKSGEIIELHDFVSEVTDYTHICLRWTVVEKDNK